MKKILLCLLILLAISAYSQQKLGFVVGTGYSMFTNGFAKQINGSDGLSYHFGAVYELPLNAKITFRPKLLYSQQGNRTPKKISLASILDGYEESDAAKSHKLDYVTLPLDFKFWRNIYIIAGPQIGFLIKQENYSYLPPKIDKKTDLGLHLGTGFTVNNFFAELSAYQGLNTLFIYKESGLINTKEVRNATLQLSVGYTFRVRKDVVFED
ncbi:porin family protein [Flavobacterium sp. RNTU_13]|uniref:porin family protein n=1 Tax=Flavobacterium sp. RNTU_13 TaxID=3375145 RepID=UPI0039877264